MIAIRPFQPDDADNVSALFRAVYGNRYVYPDIYLPAMVRWHNQQGGWQSAVAEHDGRIIGHAALWRNSLADRHAELAMFATLPAWRHRGVATALGQHLCAAAQPLEIDTLTIKMVCSHPHSQRLAKTLGFHSTALLRDYVVSPFEHGQRESVILGVLALRPRPVPRVAAHPGSNGWLQTLKKHFGSGPCNALVNTAPPLHISTSGDRVEVVINQLTARTIDELTHFPQNRLVYLQAPLNEALVTELPRLHGAGYVDMGLIPEFRGGWSWFLQRGFNPQPLELTCPVAEAIQAGALGAVSA